MSSQDAKLAARMFVQRLLSNPDSFLGMALEEAFMAGYLTRDRYQPLPSPPDMTLFSYQTPAVPLVDVSASGDISSPPDPTWIPILHVFPRDDQRLASEPAPCGGIGLYVTRKFTKTEKATTIRGLLRVKEPDSEWHKPRPKDKPICATCGVDIDPFSFQDLDYMPALLLPSSKSSQNRRSRSAASPDEPADSSFPSPGGFDDAVDDGAPSISPGDPMVGDLPQTYDDEAKRSTFSDLLQIKREIESAGFDSPGTVEPV